MKYRFFSIFLVLMLMAGCSQAAVTTNKEEVAEEQAGSRPTAGGTMTLAMHKPETLNPILNRDDTVDKILRLVFEPLFIIDNEMQVTPNLAESYTVIKDGRAAIVKLKSGVNWQDGTAVTADDMIYTLDVLKNADNDTIYKSCYDKISSYTKTDNLSVQINYSSGAGNAIYNLCFPLIPRHYYRGNSDADMSPLGNGFYKFSDYTIVKEMNLTAYNSFKGSPYISSVKVKIMPDEATQLAAISAGITDCMAVDINELGSLDNELSDNSITYNTNKFEYIGFNIRRKIFSNINARQAIAHMISVEDIISDIYINKITRSITPINPLFPYANTVGIENYETDENMANALIQASGLTKSDFTFTILVNSENSARVKTADTISKVLNSNGFNTGVEAVSFEQYCQRLKEGSFDMYLGGTRIKENGDVSALLSTDGSLNFGGYSNSNTDSLISACNSAADEDSFKMAVGELNKTLSNELPVIGIGFEQEALIKGKRIKGISKPSINNIYGSVNQWFIG